MAQRPGSAKVAPSTRSGNPSAGTAGGGAAAAGRGGGRQEQGDRWLQTSQRAASRKPSDPTALDASHFVRKTKAAVAGVKPRIDTGQPRTQNRWRGRNFETISRQHAENSHAGVAARNIDIALARVDRGDRLIERKKNPFDTEASPALIQRRISGPSVRVSGAGRVDVWQAPPTTIGRTVAEAQNVQLYSLHPPWVKRMTEDKLLPSGRIRPGNVAVPADLVLPPPRQGGGRRAAARGGAWRVLQLEMPH